LANQADGEEGAKATGELAHHHADERGAVRDEEEALRALLPSAAGHFRMLEFYGGCVAGAMK
jgi:hypothetical protein